MHYVDPEYPTSIAVFTINCIIPWNSICSKNEKPVSDEELKLNNYVQSNVKVLKGISYNL